MYYCWAQWTAYPSSRLRPVTLSHKCTHKIQAKPSGSKKFLLFSWHLFVFPIWGFSKTSFENVMHLNGFNWSCQHFSKIAMHSASRICLASHWLLSFFRNCDYCSRLPQILQVDFFLHRVGCWQIDEKWLPPKDYSTFCTWTFMCITLAVVNFTVLWWSPKDDHKFRTLTFYCVALVAWWCRLGYFQFCENVISSHGLSCMLQADFLLHGFACC